MLDNDSFINKNCTLVKKDGFVLNGLIAGINDNGVIFQTEQKTSFINWNNIKEIVPIEG